MTVNSTTNRVVYTGNGVTTALSFPYYFLADADLVVVDRVTATGVETTKALTTDYTITGAGDPAGGTVTMLVAPATGHKTIIYRDPAATQGLDLVENDPLPAEDVEEAFDRAAMVAQRLKDRVDRAVRLSDGFNATFDPTLPALPTADTTLAFNSTGTGFVVGPTTAAISSAATNAAAAAASASAAATSETNAGTSETNAAASAAAAAASIGGVKVSSNDTTPSDLEAKLLVAGGLSLSTQNDGANETRTITLPAVAASKLIGRGSASGSGNRQEIALGTGLSMSGTTLSATATSKVKQRVSTQDGAVATGTTTTPYDDTIPQNTEGDQYMSLSITPTSSASYLVIEVVTHFASSATGQITVALHQDSVAGALAAATARADETGASKPGIFRHIMLAGTTSATTFKVRAGNNNAGTTTFNGTGGGRVYGGVFASSINIWEVEA
jgi:hypothetical protein